MTPTSPRSVRRALQRQNGIARRLLVALVVFSTVVTTLLTAVELYADFRNEVHGIDDRVDSIRRTILPAVTQSVWVGDGATIQAQLNGLLNLQDIEFVEVRATSGEQWSAGRDQAHRRVEAVLPILRPHRGLQEHIGDLRVVGSIDSVIARLWTRVARILVINAVKTALVTFFMLVAFQWIVGRHLEHISRHLHALAPERDGSPLRLLRPGEGRWRPDALDHVVRAINALHDAVRRSHREVLDLNRSLEARVAERTEELRAARDAALAADRAKSDFLSSISHEVRTPMNGLLGAIDLLRQPDALTARERSQYLAIAASSGETVLAIINDVLDFSKLRAGRVELRSEPVDVNTIAASVLDQHLALARKKELSLVMHGDAVLDPPRLGDALRFRQVMLNLIANAVKFTERGRVSVRTALLKDPAGDDLVCVDVQDTGVGIDAADRERIFRPFEQAQTSDRLRQSGTGLGLAIVVSLVEAMGGRIELQSEPGQGALFRVLLPWPPAAHATVAATGDGRRRLPGLTGRVLLVEDNDVNRLIAVQMLRLLGLEVIEAADGAEGLLELHELHDTLSVVLMDCLMPGIDGYEAVRRWRAYEASQGLRRLPIIAVTANVLPADIRRCIEAGMDTHLGKPYSTSELRELLLEVAPALLAGSPVD